MYLTINGIPICGSVNEPFSFYAPDAWGLYWKYAKSDGPVIWLRTLSEWRINGNRVELIGEERFINVGAYH